MANDRIAPTDRRALWVEPEVRRLDVAETLFLPGRGRDGGRFLDCTLS